MADELDIKDRILTRAEEMFLRFGYSKVTMDEIAANLGMSKKTLYKFFPSKEELVREIIYKMRCGVKDYIDDLLANDEMDFVEKINEFNWKPIVKIAGSSFRRFTQEYPGSMAADK